MAKEKEWVTVKFKIHQYKVGTEYCPGCPLNFYEEEDKDARREWRESNRGVCAGPTLASNKVRIRGRDSFQQANCREEAEIMN